MGKYILARGLSEKELLDIKELEKECVNYEELNMKLNWDMLIKRSANEVNDFLYYDGNRLAGFLGLYCIADVSNEIEITGMVHPDYRRRGIFKELFNAARQECIARGTGRILLITERSSEGGANFEKYAGARYSFSEYRMKFEEEAVPNLQTYGITLREAGTSDFLKLMNLDSLCFGSTEEETETSGSNNKYDSTYVAELEGQFIGKIGVSMDGEDGYIFGFSIKPEYRRRGYGREVLCVALLKLLSEQVKSVLLEVAVKNENALLLYKSCGFREATIYDYYEIVLK